MSIKRLLIANRGEIALRVAQTARRLNIKTIGIFPEDDASSLHVRKLDEALKIPGAGPSAYLDIAAVVKAAKDAKADAVHPGYGFLSENTEFARACEKAGLIFVGPDSETLLKLADKSAARSLALECGVSVLAGTNEATSLKDAKSFFGQLKSGSQMFIKAISGGGGRGMRLVTKKEEIEDAFSAAALEAKSAFGDDRLYVEQFMPHARHIEVQVLGDGKNVQHFFERDCSLQRRNQKILEIAPAPFLDPKLRQALCDAAVKMAKKIRYKGLGTFEFLVSTNEDQFAFMEANPRIQVEHTITEEILDLDLVSLQLKVAMGSPLEELGLQGSLPAPTGYAIQARINAETIQADGQVRPSGGKITTYEIPQGRGVRVDGAAYSGWSPNPRYDSLVAKLIISDRKADLDTVLAATEMALSDYVIGGINTSIPFLRSVLTEESVYKGNFTTRFLDENVSRLVEKQPANEAAFVTEAVQENQGSAELPEGTVPLSSHILGTVIEIFVQEGDEIHYGQEIAVLEAMKMEHQVTATASGFVELIMVSGSETVDEGQTLLALRPAEISAAGQQEQEVIDLDHIRPDLRALLDKQAAVLDDARPEAVAKRHSKDKSMIRENIDLLVDEGSFSEYGSLNIAAQRNRHSVETLEKISPADGMVVGTASINGEHFSEETASAVVLGYDYTVFAGTQGVMNHKKTDRMLHLAEARQLPIIFYGEGGGGRPGDVDINAASTLDVPTFQTYARLSGLVPRIAVASGRCFAGNAALMGVSDILIATEDTSLGMGGPAMIEGGGLGVFSPEEVGPVSVQCPNGVIDILAKDEKEATHLAKKALSYFQGRVSEWEEHDQRKLRNVIPENRLRVYDIREAIELMADKDSVLEMRPEFGKGMITAFIRIEGRPLGLIANNPMHLGGAIDADGSEKAARHIQLCDAFNIPILTLCDTPGFMVGPDAEKTALVRKTARFFVAAGSATVPFFTVILRKGYGLGAQAMGGGSMHAPFACFAWPTGEMGPMGLEGGVRLGYKKELAAIEDKAEQEAAFNALVDEAYARGKAVNAAAFMEIDDVIDPAVTRERLARALTSVKLPPSPDGKKRTFVDTW